MQDIEKIKQHYAVLINDAQYRCRKHLKAVIATNNVNTILSCANYIHSKSVDLFTPAQFLYSHIYKLNNNLITDYHISNDTIDFSVFDEAIDASNSLYKELNAILPSTSL